ncbi:MAG: hypothetical protein BIFFINMI_03286 [Phycisphaerae bacterium]|nr:hypothetical protein [Phycisphaerae bacterium]
MERLLLPAPGIELCSGPMSVFWQLATDKLLTSHRTRWGRVRRNRDISAKQRRKGRKRGRDRASESDEGQPAGAVHLAKTPAKWAQKRSRPSRCSGTACYDRDGFENHSKLEARGIEPRSRNGSSEASTCVVGRLSLALCGSGRQDPHRTSPISLAGVYRASRQPARCFSPAPASRARPGRRATCYAARAKLELASKFKLPGVLPGLLTTWARHLHRHSSGRNLSPPTGTTRPQTASADLSKNVAGSIGRAPIIPYRLPAVATSVGLCRAAGPPAQPRHRV